MPRRTAGRVRGDQTFSSAVRRLPPAATAGLASSYNITSSYDSALGALEKYAVLVDKRDALLWTRTGTCDEPMCCPDARAAAIAPPMT